MFNCVGKSDSWIQVCARNRSKRENESSQCRAGRNRVRKQSNGDIPTCQPLAHYARPNHRSNEEGGTKKFSGEPGAQFEFHLVADIVDLSLDCQRVDGREGQAEKQVDSTFKAYKSSAVSL